MNENNEREIDLLELLKVLWKNVIIIALATLIGGLGMFIYTMQFVKPMYSSSITIFVSNRHEQTTVTTGDISVSKSLATTCAQILTGNSAIDSALSALKTCESVEKTGIKRYQTNEFGYMEEIPTYNLQLREYIKKHVSVSQVNQTELLKLTVKTENAQLSCDIANAIGQTAPGYIAEQIQGYLSLIDTAEVSTRKEHPVTKNTAIGAMVGFVLSCAVIIVISLTDTTIRTKKNLQDKFGDIPVIGTIPRI